MSPEREWLPARGLWRRRGWQGGRGCRRGTGCPRDGLVVPGLVPRRAPGLRGFVPGLAPAVPRTAAARARGRGILAGLSARSRPGHLFERGQSQRGDSRQPPRRPALLRRRTGRAAPAAGQCRRRARHPRRRPARPRSRWASPARSSRGRSSTARNTGSSSRPCAGSTRTTRPSTPSPWPRLWSATASWPKPAAWTTSPTSVPWWPRRPTSPTTPRSSRTRRCCAS